MRRRRVDRDVREFPGVREFARTNGTLPREVNRDFQALRGIDEPLSAVYPIARRPQQRLLTSWGYGAQPHKSQKDGRNRRLYGSSSALWRNILSRVHAKPVLKDFPYRVRECVRRKERREVLFARRKAGYSGSAPKRSYYRKLSSQYGC